MASTYKRLGAKSGGTAITTPVTLYTASTAGGAIVSTLAICNIGTAAATYSVAIGTAASFTNAEYIAKGAAVAAADTVFITAGLTLDTTNKYLLVGSSGTAVSFSAFGAEVS